MSNIFNDRTDTELNERTINFQNLSVLDNTIPVLGVNNVVSGQVAGIAGLDLLSKNSLDDIKEEVLGTRLKNLSTVSFASESVGTIDENDVVSSVPILQGGKDILNQTSIASIRTLLLETRLENLKDISITSESLPTINGDTIASVPILQGGKDILNQTSISSIRTLLLETRLENLKDISTTSESVPTINGDTVSSVPILQGGKDILNQTSISSIRTLLLETRLENLKDISTTSESVPTINGDTVSSVPILQGGKDILNQSSIAAIRTLLLENTEEAVVIKSDTQNEINFHTNIPTGIPDGTNLRMSITDATTFVHNTLDVDDVKVDNTNKIICNNYAYRDDVTNPIYLTFDNEHAHFTSPGVRINQQFQIDSDNGSSATHLFTTAGNKPLHYTTKGTGNHVFYTGGDVDGENATEILNIKPDSIDCSKVLKTIAAQGTKIYWDTTSSVYTSPGELHYYTLDRDTMFWADGVHIIRLSGTAITMNKPVSITGSCTATSFIGPLTGNADTSTKIASINNSDIVQLTETQTLTNKTLTSPIITGNGAIAGVFTGDLTGNSDTSTKIASINNSDIVQLTDTQTLTNKTLTAPTITGGTITGGTITGGTIDGTFTGNVLTTSNNVGALGEGHKRFKSLYVEDIIKKNSIYYRVVNLPSTPTLNDYTNVYTLAYFYSLPIFIEGATNTYNLSSLSNMTGGQDWTSLETKGMILDLNIVAPVTGTFYLKHTSDDGVRVFLGESGTTPLTTLLSLGGVYPYPATWNNQGSTTGYASFSITAGNEYRLRLQYVENSGSASCVFEWNTTSLGSTYSTDWSSIIADNDIGSVNKSISKIYTKTLDFPETLADKVLLYGTSYKLSISNNSLDYITGDTHSFKTSTNNLLTLDNTNMTTYKTIIPDTTGAIDIGSSTKLFNNGYINTLKTSSISPETTNGDLTVSGNGSGKVIVNSNLQANLLLTCQIGVVGTTTSYAKFGVKTLGGALSIGNAAWDNNYSIFGHGIDVKNFVNNSFQYGLAVGIGTNSTAQEPYGVIKCIEPGFSWRDLRFSANRLQFDQTGTERMRVAGNIVCSTNIIPDSTINARTIGSSSNLWDEIFCENSTINTSDRTKKKEIDYENIDKYADELLNLKPCSYKMINGSSNRTHMGLISQDLEGSIFEQTGAFIKSKKTKTITETILVDGMKSSHEKEVEIPNEYNYGLRYSELISPMIKLLQKQQEQINQLVARIDILESGTENELSFI